MQEQAETAGERMMLRAAQLQHATVLALRRMEPETDWEELAQETDVISYKQLMKILNGTAHMSFRDVVMLSEKFGPLFLFSEQVSQVFERDEPFWPFPTPRRSAG